jgi:hypothetical protein
MLLVSLAAIKRMYWTIQALKNIEIIDNNRTKGIPKEIMFTNKLSLN